VSAPASALAASRSSAAALVRAARPHQWSKNLLLFAGLLFSGRFQEPAYWPEALTICAAYCAASSAAYLFNDVRDLELDRAHLRKRRRPVAAGELSPAAALVGSASLAVIALGLGALVGASSAALLVAFLVLQLAYSTALKHVFLADAATISLLFVIRAAAGAVAVGVRLSWWLVLCTALLALFLALAKRRAELTRAAPGAGRPVLRQYTRARLDLLVPVAGGAALVAYMAYAFSGPTAPAMAVTIPLAAAGIVRYTLLVREHDQAEEPERLLVRDRLLLAVLMGWAALAALVLALEV
jgi:4-hydroxybenzoate polyprenyltransferase